MALIPYRCTTPNSMGVVHSWGVRGLSCMFACAADANSCMRRPPCSDLITQAATADRKTNSPRPAFELSTSSLLERTKKDPQQDLRIP